MTSRVFRVTYDVDAGTQDATMVVTYARNWWSATNQNEYFM
jgi:hypothetical protein